LQVFEWEATPPRLVLSAPPLDESAVEVIFKGRRELFVLYAGGEVARWPMAQTEVRPTRALQRGNLEFTGGVPPAWSVASDGNQVALARRDFSIELRQPFSLDGRFLLLGHRRNVVSLTFTPDRKGLVSIDEGGTTKTWDLRAQGELRGLGDLSGNALAVSASGGQVATRSSGEIHFYEWQSGRLVHGASTQGPEFRLAPAMGANHIAAMTDFGTIELFDAKAGRTRVLGSFDPQQKAAETSANRRAMERRTRSGSSREMVVLSADGTRVFAIGVDGRVMYWNAADGSSGDIPISLGERSSIRNLVVSADGDVAALLTTGEAAEIHCGARLMACSGPCRRSRLPRSS
jgi:WD40 repeat protein